MEMVFNELSTIPLSENTNDANEKIIALIYLFKKAKEHEFKKIRFSAYIQDIVIAENYTLYDWIQQTSQRTLKDLLLSSIVHPFIRDEDDWAEAEYVNNSYFFEDTENDITRVACAGLAAADIYGTLSVSMQSCDAWKKNLITITKEYSNVNIEVKEVANTFSEQCFEKVEIRTFIENIKELELIETDIPAANKVISLRDDHGNDILKAFAKKLLKSPYILEVINSLPFNPKAVNFIRNVREDGLIEIVLHWEDKGYGMVLKTTGRNMTETQEIAKIIDEEYSE